MIDLHPRITIPYKCPKCGTTNTPYDWKIPGMRNLAMVRCKNCAVEFYADLPAGHGLNYPAYLYPESGELYDPHGSQWFGRFLRESYAARTSEPIGFLVETYREVKNPILLNCMDALYGHALSKLVNAQYYIENRPEYDLILLIQPFLKWMVPEGTAEVWTVDLPLSKGNQWNDWLASEIKKRLRKYPKIMLSVGFSHVHPRDFSISKFVKLNPLDVSNWKNTVAQLPTVTFIWREDRLWDLKKNQGALEKITPKETKAQLNNVLSLEKAMRKKYPNLDFAICGLGDCGELPDGIQNLTTRKIDADVEKRWCERYAKSHIVIGVHGSNMLLPSSLAGTVIELLPVERYGNSMQDILISTDDARIAIIRYRLIPLASKPAEVAELACAVLHYLPLQLLNFEQVWNDHEIAQADPLKMSRKSFELRS